jgi:hypothetical protein
MVVNIIKYGAYLSCKSSSSHDGVINQESRATVHLFLYPNLDAYLSGAYRQVEDNFIVVASCGVRTTMD